MYGQGVKEDDQLNETGSLCQQEDEEKFFKNPINTIIELPKTLGGDFHNSS